MCRVICAFIVCILKQNIFSQYSAYIFSETGVYNVMAGLKVRKMKDLSHEEAETILMVTTNLRPK